MHCCTWQSRLLSPYAVSPDVIYEVGRLESRLPDVDEGSKCKRKCFAFRQTAHRVVNSVPEVCCALEPAEHVLRRGEDSRPIIREGLSPEAQLPELSMTCRSCCFSVGRLVAARATQVARTLSMGPSPPTLKLCKRLHKFASCASLGCSERATRR